MQRHEIPTHLNVEDRAFLGLTMRQLMTAAIGLALAYSVASELPLPLTLRLMLASPLLAAGVLLALWQPAGRPLEEWAFVLLQYTTTAGSAVWRPRMPMASEGGEEPPITMQLPQRRRNHADVA